MENLAEMFVAALWQFMSDNMVLFCVAIAFILVDILSGLIVGWITHTYSSTKMREGLGHKLSYVFVMCAVAILQVAMFDPNFGVNFDFPLFNVVCGFIIFMEFSSIMENATILNPKLDSLIGKFFDHNKDIDNVNIDGLFVGGVNTMYQSADVAAANKNPVTAEFADFVKTATKL